MNKLIKLLVLMSIILLAACGTDSKEKLAVATDAAFAPFEYMDKGEMVGFDVDLLAAVMEEAGFDYELKNTGWEPMLASVQGGDADLAIAGITINEDRKETYDFSSPYFESTHMVVFPEGENITSAEDIKGLKIGVQTGTTGADAAEKIVGQNDASISKYESNSLAFMSLGSGDVDVVVTDNVVASEYVKNNPEAEVDMINDQEAFESEFYGLMFPKDSEVRDEIDAALQTVIEDGTYAEIYEEWFGTEPNLDALKSASK